MTYTNAAPLNGIDPNTITITPLPAPAPPETEGEEGGKGGEEGNSPPLAAFTSSTPSNAEFIAAIFTAVPEGAQPVVTAKPGDPQQGGWVAHPASDVVRICRADLNT